MTVVKHELKQSRISLLIWTLSIGFFVAICVFMFPEMKGEMEQVNELFASMGSFTAAFGMDRLNFGTFLGFYSVECGNILGLGGAFFAAFCASNMLCKEEKDKTAEFLLTHPVSRARIVTEKLAAVILQIVIINAAIYLLAVGSIAIIGEEIPWKELNLFHIAYFALQVELACICFGISAFTRKNSIGAGIGIASAMYFLNLVANIAEAAEPLKYITPFAYCEGADIVENGSLDGTLLLIGAALCVLSVAAAYFKYTKKDIH